MATAGKSKKKPGKKARRKNKSAKRTQVTPGGPVVLNEKTGIQDIGDLVSRLATALDAESPLVVDAESLKSVDIAALQVLAGFANSASVESRSIEWRCGGGALRKFAELADLTRSLRLDTAPPADEDDGLCPVF